MRKRIDCPMGSISSGTMRNEDLIPTFCANLYHCAKVSKSNCHFHTIGDVPAKTRKLHVKLVAEIESRMEADDYYDSDDADSDLSELFDALGEYAGPYFYFGSHPGDGADYGFWLSESWDEDFATKDDLDAVERGDGLGLPEAIKVSDLAEVPSWFRGEVAVVNERGNVSLYVKTSRSLREVWSVV